MKTIHACHPNGDIDILYVPFGTHITSVAKDYPGANLFWLGAPLDTPPQDYRVIRYIP